MSKDLQRLNEVREDLGLDAGGSDVQQRAALPKVAAWLRGGADDPAVALRAAQLLMADGEHRGPAVGRAEKPLRELLVEEWANLATPSQHRLLALQCLVLASWDVETMTNDGYRALALAASSWLALPSRPGKKRACVESLLAACSAPVVTQNRLGVEIPPFPTGTKAAIATSPTIDRATFDANLAHVQTHMEAGNPSQNYHSQLIAMLRQQQDALVALNGVESGNAKALNSAVVVLQNGITNWLKAVAQSIDTPVTRPTEEMLWWGQARYCYHHRRPFRALSSPAARRWWAAYELAQYAEPPQCEPAASFLVETLSQLEVPPNEGEPRTLREWLGELHETLRSEAEGLPVVSDNLARIVMECAVGLPVTWVRLHREKPFNLAALAEATALSLDEAVPSWQWSSWLLRECMLEQLIG